jgi:hypothetical protein
MDYSSPYVSKSGVSGSGWSWFTLWTDRTAVDMLSAGGNLTPFSKNVGTLTDEALPYPSILRAVAASGSLYYGVAAVRETTVSSDSTPVVLAPSSTGGQLQFLAVMSSLRRRTSIPPISRNPACRWPTRRARW